MTKLTLEIDDRFLLVAIHDDTAPSAEEWEAYRNELERILTHINFDMKRYIGLAVTDGGAPNSKQRASISEWVKLKDTRAAAVSDNGIVRGVMTALGWVNPNFRAFPSTGLEAAFNHLSIPSAQRARVQRAIADASRQVPNAKAARGIFNASEAIAG